MQSPRPACRNIIDVFVAMQELLVDTDISFAMMYVSCEKNFAVDTALKLKP